MNGDRGRCVSPGRPRNIRVVFHFDVESAPMTDHVNMKPNAARSIAPVGTRSPSWRGGVIGSFAHLK
jgi:hypothetical protein